MAFDVNGYRSAARQNNIPRDVIERTIAEKTGAMGWLTNGKEGLGAVGSSVGNILNLPSYAIGGMLDNLQDPRSQYRAGDTSAKLGIIDGIKNKRAVFEELPQTLGVDPNSKLGMGIGFAGELLTPNIPLVGALSKIGKASKIAKAINVFTKTGSKTAKVFSKLGKIGGSIPEDAGRTLLQKSYKLSASDINKIAEAIGVTDESTKAQKVIDYLEELGLSGSNRASVAKISNKINSVQKPFNKLTRTGGQVSRQPYIEAILNEAVRQEKLGTPASRRLAEQLFKEAELQQSLISKPLTDTDFTNMISKLWGDVKDSGISDPAFSSLNKSLAKAGSEGREVLRPGSQKMGRELRGLRTAEEVLGQKANTGLGTQLLNAFKPSAFGLTAGAGVGLATGNDPIASGLIGMAGGVTINNPRVLNAAGKLLTSNYKIPAGVSKGLSTTMKSGTNAYGKISPIVNRSAITAGRLSTLQDRSGSSREQMELSPNNSSSQLRGQIDQKQLNNAYQPIVLPTITQDPKKVKPLKYTPPKNVFSNKSTFGSTKKVTRGSFY